MRKIVMVLVIFILTAGVLSAQQLSLREVITQSARGVEESLPQGTMVAILNFSSPSETFSDYVIEELTGELVTGKKLAIVDRQNLALIRNEMNLQMSGDVSDESAQAIGKLLGAQAIVSGSLTNMGTYHRFRIRVISVETGRIQTQVSLDLQNNEQVAFLLGGGSASSAPAQRERNRPAQPMEAKTANARINWIYGEVHAATNGQGNFGIGVNYEHMLGSKISLGVNGFWNPLFPDAGIDSNYELGIAVSFHFYPWGKAFFVGASLGYYTCDYNGKEGFNGQTDEFRGGSGITIAPEIGWKIDVGNAGGFYLQVGIELPLLFGSVYYRDREESITGFIGSGGRLGYLGVGYAF